jgi:carboxyl-terminal processing protease
VICNNWIAGSRGRRMTATKPTNPNMKKILLILFIALLLLIPITSQALSERTRLNDVNYLIDKLEKNYAYTWLKKIDWSTLREKYTSLSQTKKTPAEHYELMTKIFKELDDSHSFIKNPKLKRRFNPGFFVQNLEGKYMVTHVEPESKAYKMGVREGLELISEKDILVKDLLIDFKKNITGTKQWQEAYSIALLPTIKGSQNYYETGYFHFKNKKGSDIKIRLRVPKGIKLLERSFWQWETQQPLLETKTLKNNFAYIKINGFNYAKNKDTPVSELFGKMIKAINNNNRRGLIIDLRNSNGGFGEDVTKMVSYFLPEKTLLRQTCNPKEAGCIVKSKTKLKLTFDYTTTPSLFTFAGPVVLLTNSYCRSGCEMFAAAFKMKNRAFIIGEQTAGAGGSNSCERLPSGAAFCYTHWPVVLADGNVVEGVGVKPDLTLKQTLIDFYEDKDTVLEEAKKYLESKLTPESTES